MPYVLNGEELALGQPFTIEDVQYSGVELTLWPRDDLAAIGVEWVDPPAPSVEQVKAAKNAEVTAKREAVFAAGFSPATGPLHGHTLQVRNDQDKINWLTSATSYSAAVAAGAGAVPGATFRTMNNESVVTTYAQGAKIIVQDMAAWGQSIMQRSWDLKDAIEAADTAEAVAAIDIEVGWP